MEWSFHPFDALSPVDIHAVFALRVNVFVVEQNCPYPEVDDPDLDAIHLLGRKPDAGLVAYARIIPDPSGRVPHIGRVVVHPEHRGQGLGHALVHQALEHLRQRYGSRSSAIAAQHHLQRFYEQHGYRCTGPVYALDGIPHVDMLLIDPNSAQ